MSGFLSRCCLLFEFDLEHYSVLFLQFFFYRAQKTFEVHGIRIEQRTQNFY